MQTCSTECFLNLEPLVKMLQETEDERYFTLILESCKGYIQGAAWRDSCKFGIDACECESLHCMSLFRAATSFDFSRSVPFSAFVNICMKQGISDYLYDENRKNYSFHSPKNNPNREGSECTYEIVYYLSEDNWDMEDRSPVADVQNFIADGEAVKGLVDAIREVDFAAADAAVLVARGYSQREVATILGYNPVGAVKCARNRWVKRKLDKCVAPVEKYYKKMGVEIPIKLR